MPDLTGNQRSGCEREKRRAKQLTSPGEGRGRRTSGKIKSKFEPRGREDRARLID